MNTTDVEPPETRPTAAPLEPLVGRASSRDVSELLWCDLENDAERIAFLEQGCAMRTGIMALAIVPDVLAILRSRVALANAIQWLTDFRPESLQAGFWEAIGENDKAAEVREASLDCSPIPGLPTNRQLAEWYK